MKNFTCLLVAALLVTGSLSYTCIAALDTGAAGTSFFLAQVKALGIAVSPATPATPVSLTPASATALTAGSLTTGFCNGVVPVTTYAPGPPVVVGLQFCCTVAGLTAAAGNMINGIASGISKFGAAVPNIATAWYKISTLMALTAVGQFANQTAAFAMATGTQSGTAGAGLSSYATGAQLQSFFGYTLATMSADYTNFLAAATPCLTAYQNAIQALLCDSCIETAPTSSTFSLPTRWAIASANTGSALIHTNSCNKLAGACLGVWNFMWKAGWFAEAVAFIKAASIQTTATAAVTPAITAWTKPYYMIAATTPVTIASINTAFTDCYGAGTTAAMYASGTPASPCLQADLNNLCMAFVNVFGSYDMTAGATAASLNGVGRSDTEFLVTNVAGRRVLAGATSADGTVMVDATNGLDWTTGVPVSYSIAQTGGYSAIVTTGWTATAAALSSAASSVSSAGAAAAAAAAGTGTTTTTKSAQVLIGAFISVILAALLN